MKDAAAVYARLSIKSDRGRKTHPACARDAENNWSKQFVVPLLRGHLRLSPKAPRIFTGWRTWHELFSILC